MGLSCVAEQRVVDGTNVEDVGHVQSAPSPSALASADKELVVFGCVANSDVPAAMLLLPNKVGAEADAPPMPPNKGPATLPLLADAPPALLLAAAKLDAAFWHALDRPNMGANSDWLAGCRTNEKDCWFEALVAAAAEGALSANRAAELIAGVGTAALACLNPEPAAAGAAANGLPAWKRLGGLAICIGAGARLFAAGPASDATCSPLLPAAGLLDPQPVLTAMIVISSSDNTDMAKSGLT